MIESKRQDELIAAASLARSRAYAPYSGFAVGAAVLDGEGRISIGCNIENASYGLTNCAERTALYNAIAAGHGPPVAVAVVVGGSTSAPPCGACRQVMVELCSEDAVVLLAPLEGERQVLALRELLPSPFGAANIDGPDAAIGGAPSRGGGNEEG